MQTLAAGVWRSIQSQSPDAVLIANRRSNRQLIWWFPKTFVGLISVLRRRRGAVVVAGDALTWAVIEPIVRVFRVPTGVMVMGLDLTYSNRFYRAFVRPALRRAPRVLAISRASGDEALSLGVRADRLSVLRLGVPIPDPADRDVARKSVIDILGADEASFVMLTVGRLVRRKGVRWFVEQVMPGLPGSAHYVVAGHGPERDAIRNAAEAAGLSARVHLLGKVDDHVLETLFSGADVFVQPNIHVPGDMEGFGLVVVEAALRGTPVFASALEGVADAVVDTETGFLVPPGDAKAWREAISRAAADPAATTALGARFSQRAAEIYSEHQMDLSLGPILELLV
jgi:phosphatidylinositol alpha-1,6-mannosyltransferase